MSRSLLRAFVDGARQLLSVQLFISVCTVGLAGWTLAITSELMRERDRLRERVIQLEQTMAARGEMPPPAPAVVERPALSLQDYPGSAGSSGANGAANDVRRIIGDLFAPPPPMDVVVLHTRGEADQAQAQRIAAELMQSARLRVDVAALAPHEARQPGYAYYDGRQSRAAAALAQQFNDIARRYELAPWAAQLRGTALPARGEYAATRIDIMLPPLPIAQRLDQQAPGRQTETLRIDPPD